MFNLNYRALLRDYRELRFKNTIIPLPYVTVVVLSVGIAAVNPTAMPCTTTAAVS